MGEWVALSSERVDKEFLSSMLEEHGTSWEDACHVTATASLARGIRAAGVLGVPVATLTDLVLLPGTPEFALPADGFPGPAEFGDANFERYEQMVLQWQASARGRRFRQAIKFDDSLRRYARTTARDATIGSLLVKSRREFLRTLQSLIMAGVSPQDLVSQDDVACAATEAWAWLESEMPCLASPRRDLWISQQEFKDQSTSHARDLRARIDDALDRVFGPRQHKRVIVHHGFYFFTPPQWALFQLLRCIPNLDQIFIVHDDGKSPVFETWRRFFVEKWDMPLPKHVEIPAASTLYPRELTFGAQAMLSALNGDKVLADDPDGGFRLLECRNSVELVREWRREDSTGEGSPSGRFAADAKSVDRLVRRLNRGDDGPTDLAQLPVGVFLLAIHDCIKAGPGQSSRVALSEDAIIDIVASGFLEVAGLDLPSGGYLPALQSSLPFFGGCVFGDDWRARAEQLHKLVVAEVVPLGAKLASSSDIDRIGTAVGNPLRLAPWADLSTDETQAIVKIIDTAVRLVGEIASQERIALRGHIRFLRSKLEQGMQQLPDAERQEVSAKLDGFSVGLDEEVDVEGVVDVVSMLLGRAAEFDVLDDSIPSEGLVRELRGLDALGLKRHSENLHIANLSEGLFPSSVTSVGWPFRIEDLTVANSSVAPVTVDILSTRMQHAALSDLYLLWLALDGISPGRTLTLSWTTEVEGEIQNPSPFLNLLILPEAPEEVQLRAGGFAVEAVERAANSVIGAPPLVPALRSTPEEDVDVAISKIDPRASASAAACARRFALQWILGKSPSFKSEHHHSMLHGNVIGALMQVRGYSRRDAVRIANDLWRHLTVGQRLSSQSKAVVRPFGNAESTWILTLAGSASGQSPLDLAYRSAARKQSPVAVKIIPADSLFLPPGVRERDVCKHCPVNRSCSVSSTFYD